MTLAEMCERLKCDRPHTSISIRMIRFYCQHNLINVEKVTPKFYLVSEDSYEDFLRRIDEHRLPHRGCNSIKKIRVKEGLT